MIRSLTSLALFSCLLSFASQSPKSGPSAGNVVVPERGVEFELNKGQWPRQVLFKADVGAGNRLFIEKDRFVYSLFDVAQLDHFHDLTHVMSQEEVGKELLNCHSYQMKFVGCRPNPVVKNVGKKSYYHNYFIGNVTDKWAGEVPLYEQVTLEGLYENIDLVAHGGMGSLKYDYVLHPGARINELKLEFDGYDALYVKDHRLCIRTSVGTIVESIPYAYQVIEGRQVEVECQFRIEANGNIVGFYLPSGYDPRYALIIDPLVLASTYSGTTVSCWGGAATFDALGNIYTAGLCHGQGYPATVGAFQLVFGGVTDMAISKLNPTGTALIYATYIGGSQQDFPESMFVDANFNLNILGASNSTNFPTTSGCFDNTSNGSTDIVISKLNPAGSTLLGSTYVGGSGIDGVCNVGINAGENYRGEIIVDNSGNIFIVSSSNSANFPVTSGAYDVSQNGGYDAVLFKMNSSLTTLTWATYIGGSLNESGYGLRLDASNDLFITGITSSTNFPASSGALYPAYQGGLYDGYIARISSNGSSLTNCTFVGTSASDACYFVDIDSGGDIYVCGTSGGSMPITTGVYSNPGSQIFVMKLNQTLSQNLLSTVLGKGLHVAFSPAAFMVDPCKNIYVSGCGNMAGYPITPNAFQTSSTSGSDFYIMVLSTNATALMYATLYGSPTSSEHLDTGTSRFDPSGVVYQAICQCGTGLQTLPNAYMPNKLSNGCEIGVFKADFQPNCISMNTSTAICAGTAAYITIPNTSSLTSVVYSFQPGGAPSSNPTFTVAPGSTSTYSIFISGLNSLNNPTIQAGIATVIVYPNPSVSLSFTQASCNSTLNAFNLGLNFGSGTVVPSYNITWSPIPNGVLSSTQTAATGGIAGGTYNATISTSYGCSVSTTFTMLPVPPPMLITWSGNPMISCAQPSAVLIASPATNNYTWTNGIYTFTTNPANISPPATGSWTLIAVDPGSGCSSSTVLSITQSTTAVTSTLGPVSQFINCNTPAGVVTAIGSPSVNMSNYWISPYGGTLTINTHSSQFSPGGPGTYTHVTIDPSNGCKAEKTFSVFSNSAFPTFSLSSPQNFTLGCGAKSVATLNIVNAQTIPPGGPVSYTLLGPPTSPNYVTGTNSTYTVSVPGTWTAVTKDNTNLCETKVQVSVLQNTFQPEIKAMVPRQILNCDYPSVTLFGESSTPNVGYNWSFPGVPGNVPNYSLFVVTHTLAPTATLVSNYTLTITDNSSTCKSESVVPIFQNIAPPLASMSGLTEISCKTPTITLTNISSSKVPPVFYAGLPVIGYLWTGPTPQVPAQLSSTYIGYLPGVYTMTARDLNNGCTSVATFTVSDNRIYPVTLSEPTYTLDCGDKAVDITPDVYGPVNNFAYAWAPSIPSVSVSSLSTRTISVNGPGTYNVLITNTLNGCATDAFVDVVWGTLDVKFNADPVSGFAPLIVDFRNLSASSSTLNSTGNITSVWNFGNGKSFSTTTASTSVNSLYSQPGTYTVTLYAVKGNCMDTARTVIFVELPSRLEIPNVFTPNGDKVNDVFFVSANSLSEISALIYDRWGNIVYEMTSHSGNIAWDGKSADGKDCSEGVFYYVITATGKDGQSYNFKGTISLFR